MAYVFAPDGTPGEVPDEKAQAAFKAGYKPRQPTSDELLKKKAAEQPGQAALEGVARGATFGLSDPLLKTLGGGGLEGYQQTGKEMKARREENPVASTVGEIGGALGTSLATGGGASALAGGGLKGAVFEGGLYGMGSMVSESALENRELTSDRLAAGLVGGGLASGAVHGAFSLLGKGVSAGLSKFGGKGLKDTLANAADDLEKRALKNAGGKAWSDLNEPYLDDLLKYGRQEGLLGRRASGFTVENAEKAQKLSKAFQGTIDDQIAAVEKAAPLENNDALRMKVVNYLEGRITDKFDDNPVMREALNGAKKITDEMANNPRLTWPKFWEIQSSLFKDLPKDQFGKPPPATAAVREELRQGMRDFVFGRAASATETAMAPVDGLVNEGIGAMMRKTGRESRMARSLAKALTKGTERIENSGNLGGGFNTGIGAVASLAVGKPLPLLGGLAEDLAKTQFKKRGALMTAAALRAISESSVTNGVTRGLAGHIGIILSTAPEILGAYRYPLAVAAAKGADALLQEHLRLASSDEGSNYLSTVALPVESPEEVDAAGARLAVLDALERSTTDHQEQLDGAIDSLFGTAPGRRGSLAAVPTLKDFKLTSDSIQQIVADPVKAFEAIPPEIQAGAPSVSAEAAAKLVRMAQFLDSKMPKDPNAGMPPSVAPPWEPSKYDLDKFNRYKEAVESPARVLKNMAAGYISPEQVEALQAVYPALYADLQQKIGERLMMHKKPLSYQQRLAMSAIIGPGALSMTPQQVQILQQTQAEASQPPQPAGGSGPDGRQDVNQENNLDTQAQKLEGR